MFKPPLPYAEVDEDYHLCPLPRNRTAGKSGKQGRKYLERQVNLKEVPSLFSVFFFLKLLALKFLNFKTEMNVKFLFG